MADSFTHLHVHTEFSMLDGAARVGDLVAKAAADGQPAVGITDHGNMYGVLDFYQACRDQGVKPVIGSELYMAYESRAERPPRRGRMDDSGGDAEGGRKAYYHLTALAENAVGYKNLIQLSSRAYLEGYYMKPKVDWELLEAHSEGIIATTGCLGGQVLQALLNDDPADALAKAARLQDIFGRDNLFIELQDHGIPDQHRTNPQLLEIAKKIQAPLLATNDSHYTQREDHEAHDALLCVQTGALMSDPDRFKFHGDQHYLKTADEMRRLFAELPEACDNTLWVAERANVEIEFGKPQLPNFPIPEGFSDDAGYLEHLTFAGARERWGDTLPDTVVERLAFELKVIGDMGFSSYFLIVWDLIKHARDGNMRVGPGRGSAAGCAVAYSLRITDLDPIKYDLLFERFLNPSRISMPDIDMDFDSRYRDEMIRYAAECYGRDHVAQIVTFSTIKARAAVRDAARVLGFPYMVGDKVAKAMPPLVMGRDTPLYACLDEHPKYLDGYKMASELRDMYATDPDARQVMDVAKGLEGLRRQDGIHAAAVVITKEPLTEYLPIQRKPEAGQDPELAPVVTQYEMHGVEDLGLLKMDFLGLRNLDVISDTQELVRATRGVDLDVDTIPLDDAKTYELLQAGDSIGVFQLEGGAMRALMRSLAPTGFEDVAALVALYRPGPMAANMHNDYADRKNGRKPISYLHPDLEPLLGDTQGLMIYQEQMMRVAQKFGGYSLAEADNLRKACLPAGTLMLTRSRGYVPIEHVIRLSDRRVQTIDTTSATSRFDAVEDVWSVGPKLVYRLTTSSGYAVEATANHPFLVEDRWTELGQIRPGDLVGVAAHTRTNGGSRVSDAEIYASARSLRESGVAAAGVLARLVNAPGSQIKRFLGLAFGVDALTDSIEVCIGSPNRAVVAAVKRMLLRCGIASNIDLRASGWYDCSVVPARQLVAAGSRVRSSMSFVDPGNDGDPLEGLGSEDLMWDTVVSVEEVGERECFDFRMANPERPYAFIEDFLAHNCGKKDRALIKQEREKFVAGCEATGYGAPIGTALFDIIEPFADYAFNKSHSYGYGLVAYQTAYLKANYPVEYFAALLTSVKTNLDKAAVYLNECRQMRIAVLVPDVNVSMSDFVAVAGDGSDGVGAAGSIPFGLSAVRNVGEGLVGLIVSERDANGLFADFYDFCDRVDLTVLNKRTIESLIKAGAFDSLGHPRQGLLMAYEEILDTTVARRRKEAEGQFDLFSTLGEPSASELSPAAETRRTIEPIEFDKKVRLGFEKEMLGLYVSDHPLMGAEASLRRRTECSITELEGLEDGSMRVVGGLVTSLQRKWTKKGDLMAVFVMEDLQSSIEVMVFPKTMQQYGHLLTDDAVVCLKARIDGRDDTPKLMAMEIQIFEPITDGAPPVRIRLTPNALSQPLLAGLKALLSEHPGESQVFLHLGERQIVRLPDEFNVDASNGLVAELRVLLGPDAIAA